MKDQLLIKPKITYQLLFHRLRQILDLKHLTRSVPLMSLRKDGFKNVVFLLTGIKRRCRLHHS